MQRIIEHVKLVEKMKNQKLNLQFICSSKIEELNRCCDNLKEKKIPNELYTSSKIISKELIVDTKFADYLIEINNEEISQNDLEELLAKIQCNNEKITDYKLKNVIDTLNNENLNYKTHYDYLKYFIDNINNSEEKQIIANNLMHFSYQTNVSISELDEKERELFILPVMSNYNLIPLNNIKKVCEFLVKDNELKNIILFLYDNDLNIELNIKQYELMKKNSKAIYNFICKLVKMLDNSNMYQLLVRWLENDCALYDLQILVDKLNGMNTLEVEKIFLNKSSYVNFIFQNKLNQFPLDEIDGVKENILIYAIRNNKKNFIKLINENPQKFLDINNKSILFNNDMYNKYLNINTLTLNNLNDLQTIYKNKYNDISLLKENYYTFEELKILCNAPSIYIKFYNYLLDLKIDNRILIIRQLLKKDLLNRDISDIELEKLSEKLKIKNLYNWLENDFSHIKQITPTNVLDLLIKYDDIKKFIPQISNQKELLFIIRNIEDVQEYKSLNEIKENIEEIDKSWKILCENLQLKEDFIIENKQNIKNFLLDNGSEIALTYYSNSKDRYSYKKIIKAELMGEFKKLKYYKDDLQKEIDIDLADYQIKEWTQNNLMITDGAISVGEYDDFYSTMILGEKPQHTCLSYKDGMYNECLLACFDSNKKILYAKINGKIVARAMIRLTKGTFSNYNIKLKDNFSFVDLENIEDKENKQQERKEYITVFLEKPYISGISQELSLKIKNMFIKLLEDKANKMNALLVLSNEYDDIENKNYVMTRYYMYISKSKAGSQYLDSLSGNATVSDEGQYRVNRFMVLKQ